MHGVVQIAGVVRRESRCAASAGRQPKTPAHRRGHDDNVKALFVEELGEIGAQAGVAVGSDAGKNEQQWRRIALGIERYADVATPFERRQCVSTGQAWHVDRQTPWPGRLPIALEEGGGRRGQIGVPIWVAVLFGLRHTPDQA